MNGYRSNIARHTSAAIVALIAGLAGLSLPMGNTARAQTSGFKAADSHAVIVTGDKVSLRCGASDFHYKIGDAAKGAMLKADGEDGPWTRVTLPATIHAFVKAEQASLAGDSVELKDASKLWAPNATAGLKASWKPLLADSLASGTKLKMIETVKDGDAVIGYLVAAPDTARGFIATKDIRKATPEEAGVKPEAKPETKPSETKPAESKTEAKPEAKPTENKPADGTVTIAEPQVVPGATPQPQPGEPAKLDQGATPTETAKPELQPEGQNRRVGTYAQLDAAFKQVLKQTEGEPEYAPLLAEFDRAAAETNNPRVKRQIEQRRKAVELQKRIAESKRAVEDAQRQADERSKQAAIKIAELEAQRVYTIIGLLTPSSVYDGVNLPLMYRVQSVGGASPRTLGYIKPKTEMLLESKLGMAVGIIGEAAMDRDLMLNVITPVRVDVLQGVDVSLPRSAPEAPASPQ
ncbi:MAG: hypothetical protein U0638_05695 [Phycisphaerales bacterium]